MSTGPTEEASEKAFDWALVTSPAKLLVWLGGSTAALAAIFASAGFLVVSTYEAMLGTSDLAMPDLLHDPASYVSAGASFFSDTLRFTAVAVQRSPGAWSAIGLIAAVVFGLPWLAEKRPSWKPWLLVVVGVALVLGLYLLSAAWLTKPLIGRGLLFHQYAGFDQLTREDAVFRSLQDGASNVLKLRHGALTLWVVAFGCVPKFLGQLHRDLDQGITRPVKTIQFWMFWRWAVFALLLLAIITLPVHYGAVAHDYSLPSVTVLTLSDGDEERSVPEATEDAPGQLTLPLLLLRDDADFLTVYNPRCRYVLRLRREQVTGYVVGPSQPVFPTRVAPCPEE